MSLNLDRSQWTRVRFGDVVHNVNDTVRDPESAGIDRVIAMEHMDPGGLSISRWGTLEDGTSFSRRVKSNQTLFGKRRAYQRKVAFAEFNAICSGDILTFEADESKMLAEFLPFVVQSDTFFNHALGTSAGSLSPRTNWRDLAKLEFDLPPLNEQQRIADLLWAIDRHSLSLKDVAARVADAKSSLTESVIASAEGPAVSLGSLIRGDTTVTYGIVQAGPDIEGGVPYIRVSDMTDGKLSLHGMKRTSPTIAAKFERSRVDAGDLVVALRGRTGLTLEVPPDLEGANLTQGTARVAVDPSLVPPAYVIAIMNSAWMARQVARHAKGSTFTELTLHALRHLDIPRLGDSQEDRYMQQVTALDHSAVAVTEQLYSVSQLRSSLLAEVFTGGH